VKKIKETRLDRTRRTRAHLEFHLFIHSLMIEGFTGSIVCEFCTKIKIKI
jgi:hypothetical protein